jgi:hypothetical protein
MIRAMLVDECVLPSLAKVLAPRVGAHRAGAADSG